MGYICVMQQGPTDCGAACLATIFKHYGLKIPITKIREMSGTDSSGTGISGMKAAATELGFYVKNVKGTPKDLLSDFSLPAIAHTVTKENMFHYIVIHKITKKCITVADPAKGILKYTHEEFARIWTGVLVLMVPDKGFVKKNETISVSKTFLGLLAPHKKSLTGILFVSLICTGLGILNSFYFEKLLDKIIPDSDISLLHIISIGVIIVYAIRALLNAIRYHLIIWMSRRINYSVVHDFYSHVLKLPVNFFRNYKVGEIISRFSDAFKVRDVLSSAAVSVMVDTVMGILGAIILFNKNHLMFLIAVIIVVVYGIIVYLFKEPLKRSTLREMEDYSNMVGHLIESIEGIETVKAYDATANTTKKIDDDFNHLLSSEFKSDRTRYISDTLSSCFSLIGTSVILWIGGYKVINGELTIGELITFNSLLIYFIDPVKNLINLLPSLQSSVAAAERLLEISSIEAENAIERPHKPTSIKGDIVVNDLHFRYGNRDEVLKGINLTIHQGEKIAIVGQSGSGKTTLVKLLMNFYMAESGTIEFNGQNVNDIDVSALRSRLSYISQDTFLFSGSIMDNLTLGRNDISPDRITEIARKSNFLDFIEELPFQFNTYIGENGMDLSGGQRQRLSICRALLSSPDLLIMDEATSNLDSITERAIEETVSNVTDNMTTIIVAHRLSTIKNCDRILVMEDGIIAEDGSHEELLEKKGLYYEFWRNQV